MDLSSLITLHRLGLLEVALEYFGKVAIPARYMAHMFEQSGRMVIHQASRRKALDVIRAAVDARQIQVDRSTHTEAARAFSCIDEYALTDAEDERCYHISDLLSTLRGAERITQAKHDELLEIAKKPLRTDADHPALRPAQDVVIGLSTLETLASYGVTAALAESLRVHIAEADYDRVVEAHRQIQLQEETAKHHNELWNILRSDSRIEHIPVRRSRTTPQEVQGADIEVALGGVELASQKSLPLLADDRVCQAVTLNSRPAEPFASFGSDLVVLALEQAGAISSDCAADAFLNLVKWRYRFLMPTPRLLRTLAGRFIDSLPGHDLRTVALYVHDCMRDAGLFAGPEPTVPPMPIAIRFLNTWLIVITEFVVSLWADEQFDEKRAQAVTKWAFKEFMPSPPKVFGPRGFVIAEHLNGLVVGNALAKLCLTKDLSRASRGLAAIANAIDLSDEALLKALTETIDVF
jgi:hypothetical protein